MSRLRLVDLFACALALTFAWAPAFAVTIILIGTASDSSTGAAVVGADVTLHAARDADALAKPQFDVAYEVSGSFAALKTCVGATKRGGVVVQVGTLPHEPLPFVVNELMAKELDLRGAFRWGIEFDWSVDYLSSRKVDVRPLLSGQYPLTDAVSAFNAAADKNRSTKVQLVA